MKLNPQLRLLLHAVGAAACGGAIDYLAQAWSGGVAFDAAHWHGYLRGMAGAALIAVLAYFKASPLTSNDQGQEAFYSGHALEEGGSPSGPGRPGGGENPGK